MSNTQTATTSTAPATTSAPPAAGQGGGIVGTAGSALDVERRELLATLAMHRGFLLRTVQGVTEEQARQRSTASELCLAGIIKHVTAQETQWVDFMVNGTTALADFDPTSPQHHELVAEFAAEFNPTDAETLPVLLARYAEVAERTESAIAEVADMSDAHLLPRAPWFPPGAAWSARTAMLHVIAETAQHAGHADIIRESIDGAKTMG